MSQIITADALVGLRQLPSSSVHTIVTSPPYYKQRDYGVEGQIGLEKTPEEYIQKLVEVFREAKRVLREDGTLWVNIADSRAGSGKGAINCKPKDLMLIPFMLALALRNDGWYLRQDIIWEKPNAMPESVKDRCTTAHEYIFLLGKSKRYYFDHEAIKEPCVGFDKSPPRGSKGTSTQNSGRRKSGNVNRKPRPTPCTQHLAGNIPWENTTGLRNKRSVWSVSTKGIEGEHYATFPPELIEPCILAGSSVGGTVLDIFGGSGTVGMVAQAHGREYILIDINGSYNDIARKRVQQALQSPQRPRKVTEELFEQIRF